MYSFRTCISHFILSCTQSSHMLINNKTNAHINVTPLHSNSLCVTALSRPGIQTVEISYM